MAGRPTDYSEELSDKICSRLASGESMRTVAKDDEMPCAATMFNWLRTQPVFLEQYERAKEECADAYAEEIADIADDGTNDWMEKHGKDGENTGYQLNGEHVQRSRLRIDARKWLSSKLKPKKYGDSKNVTHSGSIGLTDLSDEELARRLNQLEQTTED